jgi:hypothetical protein
MDIKTTYKKKRERKISSCVEVGVEGEDKDCGRRRELVSDGKGNGKSYSLKFKKMFVGVVCI